MIEISLSRLLVLLLSMALCSVAGSAIARYLPWSVEAERARLPITFGLSLGPFIFGFSAMLTLAALPSASHSIHFASALSLQMAIVAVAWLARRPRATIRGGKRLSIGEWMLAAALGLVAVGLLFISAFVPLTQNDSLEYATVARILFETRTLASYPVLDPATNAAGFFGPWTHPPLYVAALYLTEVIQGHATSPGAIHLVAPWFALTATAVVCSVGRFVDRPTGLAAALIFLSTPLLFLGAGSALLDSLFVAAFAMAIASILGIRSGPFTRGAIVGVVVGFGLWTHSVAVLFIPLGLAGLTLHRGLRHPAPLVREMATAIVFALLVGGWHYWRNITLFGSPISDNPAVFALPSLHWNDYFRVNRGLDSTAAMIQYGIFKGWFAFEAFGLTYWGLTVGFLAAVADRGKTSIACAIWRGTSSMPLGKGTLYFVFGVLLVYVFGAIASVLLGIDLMVKNERYILAVQSVVAVGAGFGFVALTGLATKRLGQKPIGGVLRSIAYSGLAAALALQTLVFLRYALGKNNIAITQTGRPFGETLSSVPDYQLIEYLRNETSASSLVLSLKPADMYYSDRKMISYLDGRLLQFFSKEYSLQALVVLKSLGVQYVHVPNYGIPPLYNSALWRILEDPALSDLVFSSAGGQIYLLGKGEDSAAAFRKTGASQ